MRFIPGVSIAIFLAFASSQLWSQDPDSTLHNEPESTSFADEAVSKIRSQFELLRLSADDFKLSAGWELPLTISSIESFFGKPLDIPLQANNWTDRIETAPNLTDILDEATTILGFPPNSLPISFEHQPLPALPAGLRTPVGILLSGIKQAQPDLDRAVNSISAGARQGLLSLNSWPNADTGAVTQEISSRKIKQQYENLKPFSEADLYKAGRKIFLALDKALPLLENQKYGQKRIRLKTPQGTVLIGTSGDDTYEKKDLEGVSLLIELGGKNTYKAPVATAHEREIRIVIDRGTDVTIEGEEALHGNAGAGIFGIGVMVLPVAGGVKELKTSGFSQGFGMGGIGALIIKGTSHLRAQKMVQGTGVFGIGILQAKTAEASIYLANRSGQGAGFTRGVGIFMHEGNKANIQGGLVQPDPREPLGSVSLCQGVGFGPRAYAGGGVGIAIVKGNNNSVKGSYFSQGVGYWHGFGVYRLKGNNNTTQARRYDMGSGVHSAFGHMDVFGNHNIILNWGVGPSYGWDRAIGSSLVRGDDNEMQTEWGSGTASIGSLSFSLIQGNRNKLKLCDFGTNNFVRDEPAYSIQLIDGAENQLQCHGDAETNGQRIKRLRTPWGLFEMNGTRLMADLKLVPPEWPELPREESAVRETIDLQARIDEALTKPPLEKTADLVDVASAFSLDKSSPRRAMRELLALDSEKASSLIDALEPAAVDQLIQLSIAIPAHADITANAMLAALRTDISLQKKTTLVNLLRMSRPSTVAAPLIEIAKSSQSEDFKLACLRTMGALLNKDTGAEPGMKAAYLALSKNLHKPSRKNRREAIELVKKMRFGEAFGLLANTIDINSQIREEFFQSAPDDLTAVLETKGAEALLKIVMGTRKLSGQWVDAQLRTLNELEPQIREQFTELLQSTRAATVNAAVIGLGQIGNPEDVKLFEPFLEHKNTRVRESAAVALGRMGDSALPILSRAQGKEEARTRALSLVALTQSVSPKLSALLAEAYTDENPLIRLTALAVLDNLPDSLKPTRPKLIKQAQKALSSEQDPDVKFALQLLK